MSDVRDSGGTTKERTTLPAWAWALIGAAGAVIAIGAIAAALLIPAYVRSASDGGGTATSTVETTASAQATTPLIAEQPPQTGGAGSPEADGAGTGASAGSAGGSPGGSSQSGGGGSGGGSTSADSTVKLPGLVKKPTIPLSVASWIKAYPADSNDWFYGTNDTWTQPFELPAGKVRVVFVIDTGGAAQAKVGMISLANEPTQAWTVPGLTLHHEFVFETTTTSAGTWMAVAQPVNGQFTWRMRVDRWGFK